MSATADKMLAEVPGRRITPVRGLSAGYSYLKFLNDPVASMLNVYRRKEFISVFGNVMPFRRRERLRVLALGPEFNRAVLGAPHVFLSNRLTVPGPRNSAHRRLSDGLTALNGAVHQEERRLAIPMFQKDLLETYCPAMADIIDGALKTWPIGGVTDMWTRIRDVALRSSVGFLFRTQDRQRAYELGLLIHDWICGTWSLPVLALPVDLPCTPYRRLLQKAITLENEIIAMIDHTRHNGVNGSDVFSHLIRSHSEPEGRNGGMARLVGQVTTLFAASYETTVNTLTWTLFLLAQHPRIMADVLDELDGALRGGPPAGDQLDRLSLLEAVIKESMRVLSPVPYTIRQVKDSTELGSLALKKGDRVLISHYVTHHMPDLYEDPEVFRPSRWSKIRPSQYEYLPFSAGPRACIGYNFAMAVMKISLSMILQRFRLMVIPHSRIDRLVRVTMAPKFGMPMSIHRQDRRFEAVPVRGNIHEMVRLV